MTMTTTEVNDSKSSIDDIFFEQARSLVKGGECLPGIDLLAKRLQKAAADKKPLKVKLGLDPTRPDLHLGHTVVLKKLRAFQDLGHEAILIIGDATAMIGDPSGKNETRPPLTDEEVQANAETYLAQAGKVLDVDKTTIVRNSQWFKDMNLGDFLKLSARSTVAQILERDDFNKRYTSGKPIFMHELFYPLMQGYDSVMIESDIELGGSDQRFNNLMGRELQTAYGLKMAPQLVILAPILEGTDGKVKMSKSYPEHCINITDAPDNFFGKLMSIPDELIPRYQVLLTPMTEAQIHEQVDLMAAGKLNPRDVKAGLGKWLVSQFYSREDAEAAEQAFVNQFAKKKLPDDIDEIPFSDLDSKLILDVMVSQNLSPSKSEAKRLIAGGGVKLHIDGAEPVKVSTDDAELDFDSPSEIVLQVGKRKFVKIKK